MAPLAGRSALITGANRGLGLAIAEAYVSAGAHLMICARDEAALFSARDLLRSKAGRDQRVEAQTIDVSDRGDVQRLAERTLATLPGLSVLVNNAGIYGPMGPIESVGTEEWVRAIEINLLGSVWMAAALVPHFKRQRYGKVIQISGGGATAPLPRLSAYAASKAAVVRFAETLAEELRDDGVDVNSIAPGALNTRLLDEVLEAGPDKVGASFYEKALVQKEKGGAPLDRGAALAVFLASAASDGITGKLISALWDRWEELPSHLDELRKSDVLTLRRIVPEDRDFDWNRPPG